MEPIIEQMGHYAHYHQKTFTKITHTIGIPLAIIPIFILFNWVNFGINGWFHLGISWIGIACLFFYYRELDQDLAIAATIGLALLNIIARLIAGGMPNWIGLKWFFIIFVIAWAIQLIGHWVEGKKPAFIDNLSQVLIAPLFITAEAAFFLGKKQALKQKIETSSTLSPEVKG